MPARTSKVSRSAASISVCRPSRSDTWWCTAIGVVDGYGEQCGFIDPETYDFTGRRGLSEEVVKESSWVKQEPGWMTAMRLRSLQIFWRKAMPTWGADVSVIGFDNIFYYVKA